MANERLVNGRHKDVPIQRTARIVAATAGSANDLEVPIDALPDITKTYASGVKALAPGNYSKLRSVLIVPVAAITGNDTHNFTWNINQWRAGAFVRTLATYALTHTPLNDLAANTVLELIPTTDTINPGDVITFARVSNDSTGLASPLTLVVLDYMRA